jgi:hypothetical protein
VISRRAMFHRLGAAALALPFYELLAPRAAHAATGAKARRLVVFYFPDGVPGPSGAGEPSAWHARGGETNFTLTDVLFPLAPFRERCVFLNGLSMGPTDSGSHPGGAKKLLTAADGGQGESFDQYMARTAGADAPFRHLYLGAMANAGGASGDKHISYIGPGQTIAPQDNPLAAIGALFPGGGSQPGTGDASSRRRASVLDGVLAEMAALRSRLGAVDKRKLDIHLESLREVERRVKSEVTTTADCSRPVIDTSGVDAAQLYDPSRFPAILRAQIDTLVTAFACGLTRVGVVQASNHTSELVMSRFAGSEMHDPGYDMRSHQASHYGNNHDLAKREYRAFVQQRKWFVAQFAHLLAELARRPEGDGSMLDHTIALMCTEVCDGNTHLHDDMPFVLAGGAGGLLRTGRLLSFPGRRHADLFVSLGRAMGEPTTWFGQGSSGGLPGLLTAS